MDDDPLDAQDARVEQLWRVLDTRKEGQLDITALKRGLKKMDHPLKNADLLLHDVIKAVDTNRDGKIQYNEFRVFVGETEKELRNLFNSIDRDHNGKLDKAELQMAFRRSGLAVPSSKLDRFFAEVDTNQDGVISFDEWRNFLLFMPVDSPGLKAVLSYYSSAVMLNAEGDVHVSDETIEGTGYFLAGGIAGVISRTATAPLDRLKVYLIAQTGVREETVDAIKKGDAAQAAKKASRPLIEASKVLWQAGGLHSLFAGNGLNVLKVMPESAIKFGSYEGSKRALARLEGHGDPRNIHGWSKFVAGGMGGMISHRVQCETVEGGVYGNQLIADTARKMWRTNGFRTYYRGLTMGLVGMFPYAAIDLGTFEYLKRSIASRNAKLRGCHEEDAAPGSLTTAGIGAVSGALGASIVYPLNLLRTRLQAQGTAIHPPTYTGIVDVTRKTISREGVRGLFKGITPNLLKVVPAVSITYVVYEKSKSIMDLT
ncbi:MAG: hypothetical protein M1838_001040 [Thelocarpon superellum]|nr:MAG: hypothetical protein M1838_001040 [Thelocarpon superellum]